MFIDKSLLLRIKAELLCYGISITDPKIMAQIREQNPFNELRSGLGYGWYINLGNESRNVFVNASVYFEYTSRSPFFVFLEGNSLLLAKNIDQAFMITPIKAPDWYFDKTISGIEMGRIFQQHGINSLASAIYSDCEFFSRGEECKFCMMGYGKDQGALRVKKTQDLVETIARALDYNPNYEIDLNGGTTYSEGTGLEIFMQKAKAIREAFPNVKIAVEAAPPLNNEYLDQLKSSGVNVIMMNLEIFDEDKRQEYCPGKSRLISRERYFEAFEYSLKLFGKGNVSSCLIAGLESPESTIEGARTLIRLGVIPSILPYRPLNFEKIPDKLLNPDDFMKINAEVGFYLLKSNLTPSKQAGCVGCTGCSLESDLSR